MMTLLRDDERKEILKAAREGEIDQSDAILDTLAGKLTPGLRAARTLQGQAVLQLVRDVSLLASADGSAENEAALRRWLEAALDLSTAAGKVRFHSILKRRFGLGYSAPIVSGAPGIELPQRIVFRDKTVAFDFLRRGATAGDAVACIAVPAVEDGQPLATRAFGTAWMITPTHVVTALHVMQARPSGQKASAADFDAQVLATRVHFGWTAPDLHDDGIAVKSLAAWRDDLDVAVLELERAPPGRQPLVCDRRALAKPTDELSSVVNVVQHPGGREKRIGLRANALLDVTARDLLYFTDTDEGASGAPVMDDDWHVLAVHRGVSYLEGAQYMGRTVGYANVGTRISALLDWLQSAAPAVHDAARIPGPQGTPPVGN